MPERGSFKELLNALETDNIQKILDELNKKLVRELVRVIKRDLSIDWTNSEIIKGRIRANVKLFLFRKGYRVKESEEIIDSIYEQTYALYKDFSPQLI